MEPTIANAILVASKAQATLANLEAQYPDSAKVQRLHRQLNTLANFADVLLGQSAGTFGGVAGGPIQPDTGGTGKGDES